MFYCEKCRWAREWPESLVGSFGVCEICDEVKRCYDVPSAAIDTYKNRRHVLQRAKVGTCGLCEKREPIEENDYICVWCRGLK